MLTRVIRLLLAACLCLASFAGSPAQTVQAPESTTQGVRLKRPDASAKNGASGESSNKGGEVAGAETGEDEVVRVETSLVTCDVLVLNKDGRGVLGLTAKDFVVTEDGKPQEIGTFSLGDNANVPRSIALIIDYSGSQFPYIYDSIRAAQTLVDQLNPRDRMAIVTDDVELLVPFTTDRKALKDNLEALLKKATSGKGRPIERFGRSQQYSALLATLNELFDAEDTRPIIIFQTDGDELVALRNTSIKPFFPANFPPDRIQAMLKAHESHQRAYSLADIYRAAEKSRVTIYSVIPGVRLIGLKPDEEPAKVRAFTERMFKSRR